MRELGTVLFVQIQKISLKAGVKPNRYYDPSPLTQVDKLLIMEQGVTGITADGVNIVDVHHALHTASRSRGNNGISLGFTSHYGDMRGRFGERLVDGIGGENIMIQTDESVLLDYVGRKLLLRSAQTGTETPLRIVEPMAPCREFTTFCLNQGNSPDAESMKAALQFLDDGRRGQLVALEDGVERAIVAPGDVLFVMD